MTQWLSGRDLIPQIETRLHQEAMPLSVRPGLAVVLVGDDPASQLYVGKKQQACKRVGFYSEGHFMPGDTTQAQLLALLEQLNHNPLIHGILVQLPLPSHIDAHAILAAILPEKDVDGFHPMNVGKLLLGLPTVVSCTPLGIMQLLRHYEIPLRGQKAVVLGRSNIVGKPMALLLLQQDASVTVLHSKSADLRGYTQSADIIVAAVGQPGLLTGDMVKPGVTVIDVGMNRVNGKLVGDVDAASVAAKAAWLTPVPGGVGPMTVAMLLTNTLQLAQAAQV